MVSGGKTVYANWWPQRKAIHGQQVTWQQFRERNESTIVLLDIETGEQTIIGDGGRRASSPLISEDYVVWAVTEPCDVLGIPPAKLGTACTLMA